MGKTQDTATGETVEEEFTISEEGNQVCDSNTILNFAVILNEGVDTVVTHFDPDLDALVAAALLQRATGAAVEFRSANEPVGSDEASVVGVDVKNGPRSFKGADASGGRGSAAWLVLQAFRMLGIGVSDIDDLLVTIADEVDRAVKRGVGYGFLHLINGMKDLGASDHDLIELTGAIMRRDQAALLAVINRISGRIRSGANVSRISFGSNPESELSAAVALAESNLRACLIFNPRYCGTAARRDSQTIVDARRSNLARDLRTALRDGGKFSDSNKRQAMVNAIVDEEGELQALLGFLSPKARVRLLALALLGPSQVAPLERRSRARMYAALEELGDDMVLVIADVERPRATKGAKRLRAVRDAGVLFVVRHGVDGSTRVDPTACGSAWLEARGLTFADFAEAVLPGMFHVEAWGAVCGSTKAWATPPEHDHDLVSSTLRSAISLLEEGAA